MVAVYNYFNTVNLLAFNKNAADCYASLLQQKIRIGTQDLRIAAIAISNNAILVTRNQRDFCRIPGLQFEDWTARNCWRNFGTVMMCRVKKRSKLI